jgi:hypothetical protein
MPQALQAGRGYCTNQRPTGVQGLEQIPAWTKILLPRYPIVAVHVLESLCLNATRAKDSSAGNILDQEIDELIIILVTETLRQ